MNYLELAGVLTGLLYLWFEYRVSIWLWPVSVVMPALYIFIYYSAGLYADSWINGYFLLASVYGWWKWRRQEAEAGGEDACAAVQFVPVRLAAGLLPLALLLWMSITYVLVAYTDSTVPLWDGFTTALSVVALWMLSRKYAEQWLVWLAVDVVSSGLYFYKGLYFTAGLYLLYAVIAFFGFLRWKQLALRENRI